MLIACVCGVERVCLYRSSLSGTPPEIDDMLIRSKASWTLRNHEGEKIAHMDSTCCITVKTDGDTLVQYSDFDSLEGGYPGRSRVFFREARLFLS